MKNTLLLVTLVLSLNLNSLRSNAQCMAVGNGASGQVICMYQDTVHGWLYTGGGYTMSGTDTLNNCGYWNDTTFHAMGTTGLWGASDSVWCMTEFGGKLYIGGSFVKAGGITCNGIAMWDGLAWHAVGSGFDATVHALATFNGSLYAAGDFTHAGAASVMHLAKWNGANWNQVAGGINDGVDALCAWKNGLYISGDFTLAGSLTVNHICKWNDTTFSALGIGMGYSMMGMLPMVHSMCVYNGCLYAGGMFDQAGGMSMINMAKWNGTAWASIGNVGTSMSSDIVSTLCVYNNCLFAGGVFGACGSTSSSNIGIWNGTTWTTLGSGMNGSIHVMTVYHNKIYIGGSFTTAAGTAVKNIASYSTLTGIESIEGIDKAFSLFPNPARNTITCAWEQGLSGVANIQVFNISGVLVCQKEVNPGNNESIVDLTLLNPGMYFMILRKDGILFRKMFSVSK
ncbi:MAG: T9SS type A sorting domain-containing protein [Bacteroidia bacterium]